METPKIIEVTQAMTAAEQQKFQKQQLIAEELFTITMLLFFGKSWDQAQ
jgi:hypothetical protein